MKIGIVGHGFVGGAVDYGFTHPDIEKYIVDPKYGTTIKELCKTDPKFIFVCVPTPMSSDGSIDASIVLSTVKEIDRRCRFSKPIVILKSTVTPDIIEELSFYNGHLVYNPEFLLEKNAKADFVNPPFHIIGGSSKACFAVSELYEDYSLCNKAPFHYMTAKEASFVKYGINCFLATKVTFFNQLYDACVAEGCNFNKVARAIGADARVGLGHTKVPGFDGKMGYGGACFPKDTAAFVNYNESLTLVQEIIRINNGYRKQYELDEREKVQNIRYGE